MILWLSWNGVIYTTLDIPFFDFSLLHDSVIIYDYNEMVSFEWSIVVLFPDSPPI